MSGSFGVNKIAELSLICRNGAQGRNRTTDTAIFSRMLYQLSYLGTSKGARPGERAVYSQARLLCLPARRWAEKRTK